MVTAVWLFVLVVIATVIGNYAYVKLGAYLP